jgi:hypothetical protein
MINKGVLPLQLPLPRWPPPPLEKFLQGYMLDSDTVSNDDYRALPNVEEENSNNPFNNNDNDNKKKTSTPPTTKNSNEKLICNGWFKLSKKSYFTVTLEWVIDVCLLGHIHDESFSVNPEFIRDADALK